MGIHQSIIMAIAIDEVDALIKAFRLYREQCSLHGTEPELSFTRAWRLIAFVDAGMLRTVPCTKCGGMFVMHTDDLHRGFVCGLCHLPSRAGKTLPATQSRAPAPAPMAAALR
jgi:flagellar transcriptional activator FlhC